MRRGYFLFLLLMGSFCCATTVWAQALPDAGQVNRDDRLASPNKGDGLPKTPESIQTAPINTPAMQAPASKAKLPVSGFRLVGNHAFTADQLVSELKLALPFEGVAFDELSAAVDRISRFYRAQGYAVARAYIPQQRSPDGIIQITVLEGNHVKRVLTNTSNVKTERIQALLQKALCQDQILDCVGAAILDANNERAIRLLGDLPGVKVSASLQPGTVTGTSALNIETKPATTPTSSLGIDNYGSKSTGLYRINASTDFNNLRGEGDQLSLAGSTSSKHIWSASVSYSVLAGNDGVRVGLSAGHSQYLLGDVFAALNAHGDANTIGGFVSYPVIRHRDHNFSIRASADNKILKDLIDVTNVRYDKRSSTYALSAYGDLADGVGGGGYSTFSAGLNGGNLRLLDAASQSNDSLAKTAGVYRKLVFSASRQQALAGAMTLFGSINGQTTNRNLDGSEKFGLSGPGGVRGYPSGEAGGDKGAVASIELRYTQAVKAATLTYAAFVDRGWTQTNINPWAGLTAAPTRSLTGYGFGLLLSKTYDYSVRLLWAMHPASQPSVADVTAKSQVWLQASKSF